MGRGSPPAEELKERPRIAAEPPDLVTISYSTFLRLLAEAARPEETQEQMAQRFYGRR